MCAACRARNLDCVYGREASKGRPRGSTSSSGFVRSASQKDSKTTGQRANHRSDGPKPAFTESLLDEDPTAISPRTLSTGNSLQAYGVTATQDGLIATELEQTFRRIFLDYPPQESPYGANILASESERTSWDAVTDGSTSSSSVDSATTQNIPLVTYKRLFFGLIPGLVELVSARFGSLGFCQCDDTLTQYFALSLAQDRTVEMFDSNALPEMAPKYNDHQICQMIELWFFHHPLSFIISKTLLLHSYRSGNHDESLLAVILAGASFAIDEAGSVPGQKLYQWAQSRLCNQKAQSMPLPAIQSLILLGWHELCLSQARRGYCFLETARVAIIDFHTRLNEDPRTEIDWINGVDIGKVELELCQRMYWLTFALELWGALQKDIPFLDPMPLEVEVKFPPLDEAASAVLTLDKESGNIATLGAQERAMRELWPLSQIASTIESIYALYPRHAVTAAAYPSCGWVSQTLPRLRHLLDSPSNLSDVCQRIRDILSDGLDKFQSQMGSHPSEIFTLSVYRTLIIHLLFPRVNPGELAPRLTQATFNDTVRFVTAFKDVLRSLNQPTTAHNVLIDSSESTNPQMAVLGLDTCGRALHQLFALSMASSVLDQDRLMLRQAELAQLARDLHEIAKHPRLRAVPALSMVKKSLKGVRQCFERRSPGLTPQVCGSDPWPGSLSCVGSLDSAIGMASALDPQMIGDGLGNSGFQLPSDFIFDGNMANWNENEWDGAHDQAILSGVSGATFS